MKVLIVGIGGFIGARLATALHAAGHEVIGAARHAAPGGAQTILLDYTELPEPAALSRSVSGFDVVINAVGILRARGRQTFDALHDQGPRALFTACVAAGVPRIIQISALGADADATSGYHRSKYAADDFLRQQPVDWAIVQPSLVYGAGGSSAQLFNTLAALPVTPLPAGGTQRVQPVFIDDLVSAVVKLAESPVVLRCVLPVVGPEPLTLREFLRQLRQTLGLAKAPQFTVPRALVGIAARAGDHLPGALLDSETFAMLERGNTSSAAPLTQWLGRSPRAVAGFISPAERQSRGAAALLLWLLPLLRIAVAAMWLIAAVVSMGPYPIERSVALLQSIGIPATLAPLALLAAIGFNLTFAVLTLLPRRPAWLWSAQISIVLAYTFIISWRLPELWLEPFGPVAKNLPILALLLVLHQLEPRR